MLPKFSRGEARVIFGHEIGNQTLVARRVFPRHNDRLVNASVLLEYRLDFAQLYPEPADLYLMVDPSEKLDVAVGL